MDALLCQGSCRNLVDLNLIKAICKRLRHMMKLDRGEECQCFGYPTKASSSLTWWKGFCLKLKFIRLWHNLWILQNKNTLFLKDNGQELLQTQGMFLKRKQAFLRWLEKSFSFFISTLLHLCDLLATWNEGWLHSFFF